MRKTILCLVLSLLVVVVGFIDVPEGMEGVAQVAFFGILVFFVVLMVRHLAEDH